MVEHFVPRNLFDDPRAYVPQVGRKGNRYIRCKVIRLDRPLSRQHPHISHMEEI